MMNVVKRGVIWIPINHGLFTLRINWPSPKSAITGLWWVNYRAEAAREDPTLRHQRLGHLTLIKPWTLCPVLNGCGFSLMVNWLLTRISDEVNRCFLRGPRNLVTRVLNFCGAKWSNHHTSIAGGLIPRNGYIFPYTYVGVYIDISYPGYWTHTIGHKAYL